MIFLKKNVNKFTRWLFINKFFDWQTVKGAKHLATTKQNHFLVKNKNFLSMPLWSPFIKIPVGIVMFFLPFTIFGIATIFNKQYENTMSLIIFSFVITLTLVISNIWFINCNDGFKAHNKNCELIQDQIDQIDLSNHKIHSIKETWTSGFLKIVIMTISIIFLSLSILGFFSASLTIFAKNLRVDLRYPYFNNWILLLFSFSPWKNALIIGLISQILLIWFINMWIFINTPWYFLSMWKKTYVTFNIVLLNFIIIAFWSVRFDDEEKIILPSEQKQTNNVETTETTYATTSSIINQVHKQEIEINDEQIITRIVPLDPNDENK